MSLDVTASDYTKWRSFAPLQKSRRNYRFYVWTKALFGTVFVPAQELSGRVWSLNLPPETSFQGGKTFCASFCAPLIAGSRRAFLCVECWLCLSVAGVLSEKHEVRTFAPCKAFYLTCLLFCRRLKITLDSDQPMLKEKRIISSVWGGIKGFEHF